MKDTRTDAEKRYDATRLSPLSDAERYAALDASEAFIGQVYGPGLSHAELIDLAQRVDAAIAADTLPPDVPLSPEEEVLTRLVLSQYDQWADIFKEFGR